MRAFPIPPRHAGADLAVVHVQGEPTARTVRRLNSPNGAPADLRGTAYGFFNLVSGVAMLFASVLAGLLWDRFGASQTFVAGAVFSALALAAILFRSDDAAPRS